jgi:uncharacterized membrane protein YphA (DoxX/SURF4 family)
MMHSLRLKTVITHPSSRIAAWGLRLTLAAGFLSAVADRFGIWGKPGATGVAWGDWVHFLIYTEKLNWFLPHLLIAPMGELATFLETFLALGLLVGICPRFFAFASAGLLLLFALSMTLALGIKAPLNYSVYTAAAAAVLLGTIYTEKKPPQKKP